MLTLQGFDPAQPYAVDCDGETWMQQPGETLDQLKARAMAGAALHPLRKEAPFPVRLLCAHPLPTGQGLAIEHAGATD
jgi:hypothetical protein